MIYLVENHNNTRYTAVLVEGRDIRELETPQEKTKEMQEILDKASTYLFIEDGDKPNISRVTGFPFHICNLLED